MMTHEPIPMLLWCPMCHERHIDVGEFATKPHHTHACQHCGVVWRPAVVPTVGVQFLPGFKDPDYSWQALAEDLRRKAPAAVMTELALAAVEQKKKPPAADETRTVHIIDSDSATTRCGLNIFEKLTRGQGTRNPDAATCIECKKITSLIHLRKGISSVWCGSSAQAVQVEDVPTMVTCTECRKLFNATLKNTVI